MSSPSPSLASPVNPPSGTGASSGPDLYQSGPSTSDQWLRKFSLTLLGAGGQSWTLSDSSASGALSGGTTTVDDPLRITFSVRCARLQSRQSAVIKVYNLARSHPAAGLVALYNRVVLRAGYLTGNFGTLIDGTIVQLRQGREPTLTETYLEITVQGDLWANVTTAAQSFSAGATAQGVVSSVVGLMSAFGTALGSIAGVSSVPFILGRVHYGMAVDVLSKYGIVSQQNNVVNVVGRTQAAATGGTIAVNAATGLIGMPEIKGPNGVEFAVNLNPAVQVGTIVQLDNAQLNLIAGGTQNASAAGNFNTTKGPGVKQFGYYVDPSADGTYLVVLTEHVGDSRGNTWETRVTAWPKGAASSPGTDLTVTANALNGVGAGASPDQDQTQQQPPQLPPDNDAGTYQAYPGAVY
jgi:hypothetical protein